MDLENTAAGICVEPSPKGRALLLCGKSDSKARPAKVRGPSRLLMTSGRKGRDKVTKSPGRKSTYGLAGVCRCVATRNAALVG